MKLLLVEDNEILAKGLIYSLNQSGFEVIHKLNIKDAISFLENESVNLAILDISLPDGNGFDLYKQDIKPKNIPSIFLTARDDEDTIVRGLELGADDYIIKPFRVKEVIARINKILSKGNSSAKITINDIEFDFGKMCVFKNGKKVKLTSLEIKILGLLFSNLNKVVTRNDIIEKIWEWTGNDVNDNTVTVYFKRIREKLENTDIIKTVKGIGYRIDID